MIGSVPPLNLPPAPNKPPRAPEASIVFDILGIDSVVDDSDDGEESDDDDVIVEEKEDDVVDLVGSNDDTEDIDVVVEYES